MERSKLVIFLLLIAGCGSPETRLLSWYPQPASLEAKLYDLHDPFPERDAGPDTYSRPRDFLEPRSDSQKSLNLRKLKAMRGFAPAQQAGWGHPIPLGALQYHVQPLWQTNPQPIAIVPTPGGQPLPQ